MKFSIVFLLVVSASRLTSGAQCHEGWKAFREYCYLVDSTRFSWSDALAFCKEKGGDLVKITSQDENDFVLALARDKAPSLKQVWIGLMWVPSVQAFYWSDYSVPVYTNWAPNEPNGKDKEPCSNMWTGHTDTLPYRASAYWNDFTCENQAILPCATVCKKLL